MSQLDNYFRIAKLCDLCGNFMPSVVKESTFLHFPKTEPVIPVFKYLLFGTNRFKTS